MLRLTRAVRGMQIPLPEFSKSRFEPRKCPAGSVNLNEIDKIKLANWNIVSILLTFVPIAYMMEANYYTSPYTEKVIKALGTDQHGTPANISYDKKLFDLAAAMQPAAQPGDEDAVQPGRARRLMNFFSGK